MTSFAQIINSTHAPVLILVSHVTRDVSVRVETPMWQGMTPVDVTLTQTRPTQEIVLPLAVRTNEGTFTQKGAKPRVVLGH